MDGDSMEWQVFQALRRLGADRAAMTLSGLCLVHCLAGVVLFSTFAVLGDVLVSPLVHEIGLGIAIVLAAWALGRGYLRHHRLFPAATGCAGIGLMAAGISVPHGDFREIGFTVLGVSLVAAAHYLNRRTIKG
ncbi:MerC domain-containing protein [Tardibacter chloracetimidivorans]|nr:MerC domain-containing protein [Tardibacter chloracetimidivorans]